MLKETFIVIDTETGGLNPKVHSLLTVGLIVMQDNQIVDQKEWKIKHSTYHVTLQALEVNGIDINEFDKEAVEKEKAGREIVRFLSKYCTNNQKAIFVGQNTLFDKNFLETFMQSLQTTTNYSYQRLISHRHIDLQSITAFLNMAGILETNGLGLDAVIEKFGLEVKARHTSLDDASLTFKGLQEMLKLVNPTK